MCLGGYAGKNVSNSSKNSVLLSGYSSGANRCFAVAHCEEERYKTIGFKSDDSVDQDMLTDIKETSTILEQDLRECTHFARNSYTDVYSSLCTVYT